MNSQAVLGIAALALLICVLGGFATAVLGRLAVASHRRAACLGWVSLAIVAATCAIWADSSIAVLALRADVPARFAAWPMFASFAVTFGLLAAAARVMLTRRPLLAPLVGGAVAGLAISAAFHFSLQAMRIVGTVEPSALGLAGSALIGIVFATLAAATWLRSRSRSPMLPVVLFAAAVSGDHLVAMRAVTLVQGPGGRVPLGQIDDLGLLAIVGTMALLIVGLTMTARSMNRKSRLRSAAEKRQLQQLAEVAVEGLVICDGSRVVWINRSLEKMVPGVRDRQIGAPIESLLAIASLTDHAHDREFDTQLRVGSAVPETAVGAPSEMANGLLQDVPSPATIPVRVITRAIEMGDRPHVVIAIRDQRDRLRAEAEMHRLATSDALTGLANRARFAAVLEQRLRELGPSTPATPPSPDGLTGAGHRVVSDPSVGPVPGFALLSLDLDRFKAVNDTRGHGAGDAVLVEVAQRLLALVREVDLVARLGGDEFAILAATGSDPDAIAALAVRAIETIGRPFRIDGRDHQIGVSIGIAFAMQDGADMESLTRSADLALYRAKEDGRGIYRLFEPALRTRMEQRHSLEQALRIAVSQEQFQLHYQPQVDARSGAFVGAEALIRWVHPERGLVMPSEFIPLAEDTNLILPIGEWVLRTACVEAASWPDAMVVAVNLSPLQLRDPALASIVASALEHAGLPGRRLELEITESVLMEDTVYVQDVLDRLKALGIRLALDDFGTGYSSLGHLHRFPFDMIKVDRCFVQGIPDDQAGVAIVLAVVALGAGLGMQTTAEGVEDEAQRCFVIDAGCDQIQGFLVGRPVGAAHLPQAFRIEPVAPRVKETATRPPLAVELLPDRMVDRSTAPLPVV